MPFAVPPEEEEHTTSFFDDQSNTRETFAAYLQHLRPNSRRVDALPVVFVFLVVGGGKVRSVSLDIFFLGGVRVVILNVCFFVCFCCWFCPFGWWFLGLTTSQVTEHKLLERFEV